MTKFCAPVFVSKNKVPIQVHLFFYFYIKQCDDEASIAYWHSTKIENSTKWESILKLYNQLLQIEYSPIAALNRTYALSKVLGKEKAIHEALKLNLNENHFYYSLLGNLHANFNNKIAIKHYKIAYELAMSDSDKLTIETKQKKIKC